MSCGQFFVFEYTESIIILNDKFSKQLNAKMNSINKFNQYLTRRRCRLAINKIVLEFCLMNVQKTENNFSTLQKYIVSLVLEKNVSSFNLVS